VNKELIMDAMEYIDDDMLEDVNTLRSGSPVKHSRIWMRYVSAAACICIILGGMLVWHGLYDSAENESAYSDSDATPEMMPDEEGGADGSDNGSGLVLEQKMSFKLFDAPEDAMENADFVLIATVQEIGDSYAQNSPDTIGILGGSGELDYIRSIRTPITLAVDGVYYDSTGTIGDTLTVLEYQGTVGKYTLTSPFPMLEENKKYLLFIAQAPDGKTNIMIGQASVLLEGDRFTPLMNNRMYSEWNTTDELLEAVRLAAEKKEEQNP